MVRFGYDEELSEFESLSMTIKTMFCKREKVQVLKYIVIFRHCIVRILTSMHFVKK